MFNIQPVLYLQYYLWFKFCECEFLFCFVTSRTLDAFTLNSRSWCHVLQEKIIVSSRDQWNLTPATVWSRCFEQDRPCTRTNKTTSHLNCTFSNISQQYKSLYVDVWACSCPTAQWKTIFNQIQNELVKKERSALSIIIIKLSFISVYHNLTEILIINESRL